MVKFDIDKKGYDIEQVENYINTLTVKYEEKLAEQKDRVFTMRNELNMMKEKLSVYKNKDKQISQALVFAVEKAGQIEDGARKLYDLEIKRINILYDHWKVIIDEIENKYGRKINDQHLNSLIDEFKRGLDSIMVQNSNIAQSNIKQELKENSDNYIKNLLNKMDYVINDKAKKKVENREVLPRKKSIEETAVATEKGTIGSRLKLISSQLDGKSAEKYLNDESDAENTAYSRHFVKKSRYPKPNESGFNLEEALNPKEDLEEIMKAFDFFIPENFDKKVD